LRLWNWQSGALTSNYSALSHSEENENVLLLFIKCSYLAKKFPAAM
jgi:hypothetical protein